MKKHSGVIGYISPKKEPIDNLVINLTAAEEKRAKKERRIEKHSRLLKYLENKRLKEELDFIDRW